MHTRVADRATCLRFAPCKKRGSRIVTAAQMTRRAITSPSSRTRISRRMSPRELPDDGNLSADWVTTVFAGPDAS